MGVRESVNCWGAEWGERTELKAGSSLGVPSLVFWLVLRVLKHFLWQAPFKYLLPGTGEEEQPFSDPLPRCRFWRWCGKGLCCVTKTRLLAPRGVSCVVFSC